MDAFALPLCLFTMFLVWLLAETIRGSFEDPYPRRAGVTWAVTCPLAGLLFSVCLAPVAVVFSVLSVLALGSLCWWFLATESDDSEDDAEEPVDPDPSPDDGVAEELPAWARRPERDHWDIDWDAFDRARIEWEKETAPARKPERETLPAGV